jgi:hypothetical protein
MAEHLPLVVEMSERFRGDAVDLGEVVSQFVAGGFGMAHQLKLI